MGFVFSKAQYVEPQKMDSPTNSNIESKATEGQLDRKRQPEAEILQQLKSEGILSGCRRNGGVAFYVPMESKKKSGSKCHPKFLRRLGNTAKSEFSAEEKMIMADILHQNKLEERRNIASQTSTKQAKAKERRHKKNEEKRSRIEKKHRLAEDRRNKDKMNKEKTNVSERLELAHRRRKGKEKDTKTRYEKKMKEHEERRRDLDEKARNKHSRTRDKMQAVQRRKEIQARDRRENMDDRIRRVNEQQANKYHRTLHSISSPLLL